jgi:hypothetical protein
VASWNAFAFFFTTWCLYLRVLCVGLRRRATRLARMGRTVTRLVPSVGVHRPGTRLPRTPVPPLAYSSCPAPADLPAPVFH